MKQRNMMHKNLHQTIKRSLGRYIAIVAIIALGAAMFVGLMSTKADMVATCQKYTDQQNLFDLHFLSTYGWTDAQLEQLRQEEGLREVEGAVSLDVLVTKPESEEQVYHFCSIPEKINTVRLLSGRMPQNETECLADGYYDKSIPLGTTITVSPQNEEGTLDSLSSRTYTVVGIISSPLYMNMERGNTSIGNGNVAGYLYLLPEGFDVDYYTDLYATLPGTYSVYSDEYHDAMDNMAKSLEERVQALADERFEQVKKDARQAYQDGLKEYAQGQEDYESGKKEAQQQLADAEKELKDNEALLETNRQTIEDGKKQLKDAQQALSDGMDAIVASRKELAEAESAAYAQLAETNAQLLENYQMVSGNLRKVNDGLLQLETGLAQINAGIPQLEAGLEQMEAGQKQLDTLLSLNETAISILEQSLEAARKLPEPNADAIQKMEDQLAELRAKQEELEEKQAELNENYAAYSAQLEELRAKKTELEAQREELLSNKSALEEGLAAIELGFKQTQSGQTDAENQFSAAKAQLDAAQLEIENGEKKLNAQKQELEEGEKALAEGESQLKQGWKDFEAGKAKSQRELADAAAQLEDAQAELADARTAIDEMKPAESFVLTRETNVGYMSFESDSDIVAGVSRVFPAFFLAVAALVCITTMTRMINEERTQIGTFKGLGFGNMTIISKYLNYSGSAAILGCGLGILIGNVLFPEILWKGYCIMYDIADWVVLKFNWQLSLAVLLIYTAVVLLVTWSCCRYSLREVPAELMRPKPPTSGKKIFLEHLPFWKHLSFLNKVALRNIFRYRQRMFMMLLGIGGCTALLVTGFGLKDSISKVVDHQFQEVTFYDAAVTLAEGQTPEQMETLRSNLAGQADQMLFYHQSGVDVEFDGRVKNIQAIVSDGRLLDYMDLHSGREKIPMPGEGECVLSIGTASALGVSAGDTLTIRDPDLHTMELTVSGVFENMVANYVIIGEQTWEASYGAPAAKQSILLNSTPGQDIHELGAKLSGLEGVRNVSLSADLADRVNTLMKALDLVVILVVVCAALLAEIVLYNLTNININERIGEIATIKVLGFKSGETAAYVFKENLALTVMGSVLGLGGGKLLLDFVMSQIKIDMFWMPARPSVWSFLLAILITLLSACAVDFLFYFKLERINMAEALKPVE